MATLGTFDFTARLDASRVLTVIRTVEMLRNLLIEHGHEWTAEELSALDDVATACEPRHLAVEAV